MNLNRKFKRKCCACADYKDKAELIKITKTTDGQLILNPTSKQHGYSAYICKSEECINSAIKNKRLNKVLKCFIPQEIIEKIILQDTNNYVLQNIVEK